MILYQGDTEFKMSFRLVTVVRTFKINTSLAILASILVQAKLFLC